MKTPEHEFQQIRIGEEFQNGTGVTFTKTSFNEAVVTKSKEQPWLVGAVYRFGLYNTVEVDE
jgi:hypothetical protein